MARRNLFLSQRFATVKLMSKRSHSSSRARLLRLSQLRRRASGRSENAAPGSPNLKPHRTKARLSRLIAPLVVLALLLVGGNFYVRQNFNVEKIVRGQVIPQLEKQLQARVEIGRIESDYISGVTLHDVVIGRDKNLPLGALAQVKSATINLDIPALVLHRTDALGALRSVDLQSPRVVIRRDAKGQLNWAKLWKSSPDIAATRWTGTLTAHDGRIWYQDATVRSRAGIPVVMDAQNVQAKVVANGANPATFAATIEQTSVGHKPQQTQLKNIALDGIADNRGRWLNANVRCARVPVALLIEYSNGRLPLSARGEIGGAVQVAYDAKAPVARRLLLAGQGTAREVDVALLPGAKSANGAKFPAALTNLQTRLSRIGQPLALHKLNGAFRFDNRAFSTTGMTLQTLGSDWQVSGNAAMPANSPVVAFDVRASTKGADTTKLAQLLPFAGTTIRGGQASGSVSAIGDTQRAQISGDIVVPDAQVQNARFGSVQTRTLRAVFQTDSQGRAANVRFSLPELVVRDLKGGFLRSRVLEGTAAVLRSNDNAATVNLDLSAPDYSLQETQFGKAQGESLSTQIAASLIKSGGNWGGQGNARFRTSNLSARQKNGNSWRSRVLDGTVALSSKAANRWQVNAALNSPAAWNAQTTAGSAQGESLATKIDALVFNSGERWSAQGNADFRTTGLAAQQTTPGAQSNFVHVASAKGSATWSGDLAQPDASLQFDAQGVSLRHAAFGAAGASAARGTIAWHRAADAMPLRTDIALRDLQAQPNVNGRKLISSKSAANSAFDLRMRTLRVLVSTPNARLATATWSGVTSFAGVDASRLNLAALAPAMSRRVRNLGEVDGQAQFVFSRANPLASSVNGDFRLSRAQVDDFRLREIAAHVSYADGIARLQQARAQSEEGPLLLDAVYNTRNGSGNLGLNAPQVVVPANRINPFLKAMGLQMQGTARGQVRVATSLSRASSSPLQASPLQVSFDLRVPRARLRSIATNRVLDAATVDADEAHLVGSSVGQMSAKGNWSFLGRADLRAQSAQIGGAVRNVSSNAPLRLGSFALPGWTRGARISGLHLMAQGRVASDRTQKIALQPRLSGTFSARRAALRLPLNRVSTAQSLVAPTFALQNLQATFTANGANLQLPRWQAEAPQLQTASASNARRAAPLLSGYLNLSNGNLAGQFLGRDLDAARVQRLAGHLLPNALGQNQPQLRQLKLRGTFFARADLGGTTQNPRALLQARLYRGAVVAQGTTIPVDAARVEADFSPATSAFQLRNSVLWSGGGRLAANGTVAPLANSSKNSGQNNLLALDVTLHLSNWRVRQLSRLWPQSGASNRVLSDVDGALSGDLQLTGTTIAPHLNGRAALKLATIAGIDVPAMSAQLSGEQTPRGPRLVLTNISGRAEDATIAGAATFDLPRNKWSARLSAADLTVERLVRLAERFAPADWQVAPPSSTRFRVYPAVSAQVKTPQAAASTSQTAVLSAPELTLRLPQQADKSDNRVLDSGRIPLHGTLRAVVAAQGTFGPTSGAVPIPQVIGASATVVSDGLRWRGHELGALNADVALRDSVLHINDFSLLRHLSAREIAINTAAQKNAGTDDTTAANEAAVPDNDADDMAQVRIGGTLPLNVNDPRAAPFDTTISVENERFSVLREGLQQLGRVLMARGRYVANLDILLNRVNALPPDLEGRLSARSHLTGAWEHLSVGLDANVDNARTSTQTLPALQTSLVFVDGAIEINGFEIKQTFAENDQGDLSPATDVAAIDNLKGDDPKRRVRETAFRVAPGGRIVPGGEISLDVDVLKANLAQLAGWLPELQQVGGKALLRGELSLFSFEVRGQTASPEITGSIEARDLSFRTYTLDRLRIAQFDIKNGFLSVEPGKLTVVKGGFQSSAAYGRVPWSWGENGQMPGPRRDGPLDVHLPLQTRDFGALAGAFVPALTNVAAEGFSGSVDVGGTLDKPQLAGEVQLKNARFRADPIVGPFPFGIEKVNGALRFVGGNRVLVDHLSGQLARAQAVSATSTGNRSAAERSAELKANAGTSTNAANDVVNSNGAVNSANIGAPKSALRAVSQSLGGNTPQAAAVERPDLSGSFTLNGEVALAFTGGDPERPGSRLPFHRYDLELALRGGAFRSALYSGLRDISLDATWKTGQGAPQNAQTLAWKLNAKGGSSLARKSAGQTRGTLVSTATVHLAPDFADGLNALLHSRFQGGVALKNLAWQVRDLGGGEVDGNLKLDNSTALDNAQTAPLNLDNRVRSVPASTIFTNPAATISASSTSVAATAVAAPAITRSSASLSDIINGISRDDAAQSSTRWPASGAAQKTFDTTNTLNLAPADLGAANGDAANGDAAKVAAEVPQQSQVLRNLLRGFNEIADSGQTAGEAPLRVSGALTLSQVEITGVPASGAGLQMTLPAAPNFDVLLSSGKNVRFVSPTLRTEVGGTLSVSGTPLRPRLIGTVTTRNGQIRFPNASARIEDGTIEIEVTRDALTQELRPRATIDATARGQVGRYAITIVLRGPLDMGSTNPQNLHVDVTSNPPLSQDEAFAQLTGTSLQDLNGGVLSGNQANQAYAKAVVGLLSAPLFSGIERSLEQSLGLNSLTLDYRLNEPLGVEIGKAVGDRIFVTYRRSLARGTLIKPSSAVRVDFRIKGGVQVGAESDTNGRNRVTIQQTFRF